MSRNQRLTSAVVAVALILAGAAGALLLADRDGGSPTHTAYAQERYDDRGISVEGRGEVSVTPDVARIVLGVEVQGTQLDDLREDADDRMNDVVDALLEMGIEEADIQTIAYDIHVVDDRDDPVRPEVEDPATQEDDDDADDQAVDDAETEVETGVQRFRIVQMVQIRITDIDEAGEIIDTALDAGANRVTGISFEVEDREAAVQQARERAVEEALGKAEHLAELTGVNLGAPLRIDENSPSGPPMRMVEEAAMEMDEAADARIEPGEQTISVWVYITYGIE